MEQGLITQKEYDDAIKNLSPLFLEYGADPPAPVEPPKPPVKYETQDEPPELPCCCSGENVKWTGYWNVSAGGLGLGKSWSDFSLTGTDDSGCVYVESGNGSGGLYGVGVGYFSVSYNVKDYPAPLWPITKSPTCEVSGGVVGVGGAAGVKVSLSASAGIAGAIRTGWGNINSVSGVNLFVFAVAMVTHPDHLTYSITVPPNCESK